MVGRQQISKQRFDVGKMMMNLKWILFILKYMTQTCSDQYLRIVISKIWIPCVINIIW
jgi:hypothetical protein